MPYQANRDATISKVIGTTKNAEGEKVAHYESVTYPEGAVIFEQDIAPHVLRRLEEGDDRLSSLLRYIDEAEARQIMGQQAQEAASQSGDEVEVLHQEERTGAEAGNSPSVGPEFGTQEEPGFEALPTGGKGDSGADVGDVPEENAQEVVTDDQTVGQGTGGAVEETTTEGESQDAPEDAGQTTEEVEQQTDAEAADSSADESQEDGQGQSDEAQEESSTDDDSSQEQEASDEPQDQFSGLDKKGLLEAAKEAKIPKRTKMDEDELRAALREKAE